MPQTLNHSRRRLSPSDGAYNVSTANLIAVLDAARLDDWQLGEVSWKRYNNVLKRLARQHGTTVEVAAGVFSALSPNNDYLGNVRDTYTVLQAWRDAKSLDDFKVATYHANKRKAWFIAWGASPLSLLKFPKTRNFYLNLIDPDDPYPVTVDGHIYNAWMGERVNLNSAATRFRPGMYNTIASTIRALAEERKKPANVIQATLWHAWKRMHRIRFDNQLHLWSPDLIVAGLGFVPETPAADHPEAVAL